MFVPSIWHCASRALWFSISIFYLAMRCIIIILWAPAVHNLRFDTLPLFRFRVFSFHPTTQLPIIRFGFCFFPRCCFNWDLCSWKELKTGEHITFGDAKFSVEISARTEKSRFNSKANAPCWSIKSHSSTSFDIKFTLCDLCIQFTNHRCLEIVFNVIGVQCTRKKTQNI